MNNVDLIGRIATESKQNSGSVSTLMAVKRIYKSKDKVDADFIPLILFGHQADNFIKMVKKGQQIGVDGSIKTGEYVDADGQKRYSWSVVVNHFYLLSSDHHDHQQQQSTSQQQYQPYQSPNNQYQQPQQSSIVLPESDKQQSEQWKILSKQLDTIEKEQQQQHQPYQPQQHQQQPRPQQTQQPYRAPQQPPQQNEGIPFD